MRDGTLQVIDRLIPIMFMLIGCFVILLSYMQELTQFQRLVFVFIKVIALFGFVGSLSALLRKTI